ncbi:hypothetical protein B0I72DRAFT_44991 [Yarrowia lipolytica]|jgi:hypothetical protein|uniref:SAGA-associated factor 11 n=2 Tax=Yarrowia lipolytica TaxID=4952 RepID=Q6CGL5_YARLI|nr:YALI0A18315p [Yarrowia lipolytica CLIB122]AOW00828.1 hypothetical protein YALI1_A18817g [Yarrowia lipolytica]KAB8283369.1 hypothetical protein BKA91DRAFT_15286 [Yarrowia lipolytica]KAE8174088.1 hypothetical protein BKA90DRAFT_45630 [Yarrowia lipolytica]KAJ8051787.1 hypothetical protein LXG23DRAFT_51317 [Yarrowia lipolytica]QNP95279.1 SAGA-associated factor 11 [Yarrowia lipolytica]|eukprot:XP_500197.1 YALI0A18315p [Yarrowia lipolytica CLIB122]
MTTNGNDSQNSIGALGASILLSLVTPLTEEIAVGAFLKETRIRQTYGCGKAEVTGAQASGPSNTNKKKAADTKRVDLQSQRLLPAQIPGRDIFGRESAADSQYFECPKCMRKVAGARFCAHIERCLSGGGRSGRGSRAATSSNYSETASPAGSTSPDRVRTASPGVKRGKRQGTGGGEGMVKKRRLSDGDRKSTQVSKFLDRT